MKRLIAAGCIFAALIVLVLATSHSIRETARVVTDSLDTCEGHLRDGKYAEAVAAFEGAQKRWFENETYFGMVLRHSEFHDISISFAEADASLSIGDLQSFLPKLRAIKIQVKELDHAERLSFDNVF